MAGGTEGAPAGARSAGSALLDAVRARRREWVDLVVRLASIETPTGEAAAQRAIQDLVAVELGRMGFEVERTEPGDPGVPCLVATGRPRGARGRPGRHQLLLGHTDTVWPVGTLASMPVRVDDDAIRGPGVFDMKAGIANLILALRVLHDLGLEPSLPPVVLLDSDEETGSRASTPLVRRLAGGASRVFVLEPALGPEGRLKTARKGTGSFTVRVRGKGAHAGLDPDRGASAVHEIARLVGRVTALSDPARGIHLNVGTVRGGTRANVVAEDATAEVDLRFDTLEEGERTAARLRAIGSETPGCRIEIEGGIERVPLERTSRNRDLWEAARGAARAMGLPLEEGSAGGASDGNTGSLVAATLDGLGAVGDGAHAAEEHVRIAPTMDRAALLAGLLLLPDLDS